MRLSRRAPGCAPGTLPAIQARNPAGKHGIPDRPFGPRDFTHQITKLIVVSLGEEGIGIEPATFGHLRILQPARRSRFAIGIGITMRHCGGRSDHACRNNGIGSLAVLGVCLSNRLPGFSRRRPAGQPERARRTAAVRLRRPGRTIDLGDPDPRRRAGAGHQLRL